VEVLTNGEVKKSKTLISHRFDDVMDRPVPTSETDELVAVTYRLGAARSAAERVSGKEPLYCIDMAIRPFRCSVRLAIPRIYRINNLKVISPR
jgi:hypothetical protein